VPPVTDQPAVTPPTRFVPVRVTVTRAVRPSTALSEAAANWMTPAVSLSWIVSVALLGVPSEALTGLASCSVACSAPSAAASFTVATVTLSFVTPGPKVSVAGVIVKSVFTVAVPLTPVTSTETVPVAGPVRTTGTSTEAPSATENAAAATASRGSSSTIVSVAGVDAPSIGLLAPEARPVERGLLSVTTTVLFASGTASLRMVTRIGADV
jgi:hypothetical protein